MNLLEEIKRLELLARDKRVSYGHFGAVMRDEMPVLCNAVERAVEVLKFYEAEGSAMCIDDAGEKARALLKEWEIE